MATEVSRDAPQVAGRPQIVQPAGEKVYRVMGGIDCTVLLRTQDTGHACDVCIAVFPPQSGMPAHLHHRTDEAVYVLEGQLELQIGDRTQTVGTDALGFIPRETVHAMHNSSAAPCRVLLWQLPGADLQGQLEEMSQLPPGPPDMGQLLALFAKYDIEPVAPAE
jgi:quercetin dioxygenase-like cupin family protein